MDRTTAVRVTKASIAVHYGGKLATGRTSKEAIAWLRKQVPELRG